MSQIHKTQASILFSLRHAASASFSELMRPTGLESDSFKFHLQKLVKVGLVQKSAGGEYSLTAKGKEFANNIDTPNLELKHRPKISMLILPSRRTEKGLEYLMQQRKRQPYFGYWGNLSGPVLWGESIEEAAARELLKQTGLQGKLAVHATYRQRDFVRGTQTMLEDKIFLIVEATHLTGELVTDWRGGHNQWMTLREFATLPKQFTATPKIIAAMEQGLPYISQDVFYDEDEF